MAIGDLRSKVSSRDVNRVKDRRNTPEYEPGFEPGDEYGEDEFASLFDDFNSIDSFGSGSGDGDKKISALDIFGGGGSNEGSLNDGGSPFGGAFGGPPDRSPFGGGVFGGPFGGMHGQQAIKKEVKPSTLDIALDKSGEAVQSAGNILSDLVRSLKKRNAEDIGYYSRNLILTSVTVLVLAILALIIGTVSGIEALKFGGIPLQLAVCGLITLGGGLIVMATAAITLSDGSLNNVKQEVNFDNNDKASLFNDDSDGDDWGSGYFDDEDDGTDDRLQGIMDELENEIEKLDFKPKKEDHENNTKIDIKDEVDKIGIVPIISREVLLNTFKSMFPANTPGFNKRENIDIDSGDFEILETIALKALAAAAKTDLESIESSLESAVDTLFCYELRLERVRGLNKLDEIEREMTAYFSESSEDSTVSTSVVLEGDFYKVTINKGISAVVTLGDLLKDNSVYEFFLDTNNILPMVAGVNIAGKPILVDAKLYDTVMIAGKPRSGKSWYVLMILMCIMAFNTPEDVQLVIIDPKESNLFKTVGLMPHVCGVHGGDDVLDILRDIIDEEGARRKKLLGDHRCDDIWDFRKRTGIKLPVLYIVIDEVMSIVSNLGANSKEFFELMKVIISQLPSLGIRIIFVPHRAQGVVDKTVRNLIGYKAAIRADNEVVLETLDIKRWGTPLVSPGDTALKLQGIGKEMFVKGLAVTTTDGDNSELIINMARAFYKMGIDIPDMSTIGVGYNRNEDGIKRELGEYNKGTYRVQFDIDEGLDDIDF